MGNDDPPQSARRRIPPPRKRRISELEGFRVPPHERMTMIVVPTFRCPCRRCELARLGEWDFAAYYAWLETVQAKSPQLELQLPSSSAAPSPPAIGNPRPRSILQEVVEYERDQRVVVMARARAGLRCEVLGCMYKPFSTTAGEPYFEVHHIRPLHEGGPDTLDNVACICPGHHKEVHFGGRGSLINDQLAGLPGRRQFSLVESN